MGPRSHFFVGGGHAGEDMVQLAEEVVARLARLAASEGVELLAVEVVGTARRPKVRLVLDREGGVSLSDCELISRQASALLDAHDPFPRGWDLEVTSPGLERKFYQESDFERFTGKAVRVRMRPSWQGNRLIEGLLEGKRGGMVLVRDRHHAEVIHKLPETEVLEARLAPFAEAAGGPAGGKDNTRAAKSTRGTR